ncbi:hypothetical protein OJ998_11950 [Solirubrobacter taibaiensis]|nr:hypothetical protein [Solirubrobacter taibaiensis]
MSGFCPGCGRTVEEAGHESCVRALDPPRWCTSCGRKLKVQVLPTGVRAECVRCPA